ncbi:MAG: sigma-70 family RNA polymerase sigma factor [Planctomycetota bacterium]
MNPTAVLLDNRRWLWVVIYSRLGNAAETEDVLQEVSMAAVRTSVTFEKPEVAKGWLYRVAVRQVMLFRRRHYRDRAKLENYGQEAPVLDDQSHLNWLCTNESAEQVQLALRKLNPSDQQILGLKYSEDFSCKQIAEVLGVRETTIQSRLLRARRRLKNLLIYEFQFGESV